MGNESSTLHQGTVHRDKSSIERALILYHHSLSGPTGVSHRWIKSEKKRIHAVCVHQLIANSENRKLKQDIAKTFDLSHTSKLSLQPDIVCRGEIYVTSVKTNDKGLGHFVIRKAFDHTCCLSAPEQVRGRRSTIYSGKVISQVAASLLKNAPQLKPEQLTSLACQKLGMSSKDVPKATHHYIKSTANVNCYGSIKDIYMTSISRLEHLKEFDPDTQIFVTFYPDEVDPDYAKVLGSGNWKKRNFYGTCQNTFALRFHAITCSLGASIRRAKALEAGELSMRQVRTTDFCHSFGHHRGCIGHITRLGADGEVYIDTFSIESENENQNTCRRLYETDFKCVHTSQPEHVIVGDRLKGKDATLNHWLPETRKDHCVVHLLDNIQHKGKADDEQMILLRDMIYEKEPGSNGYEWSYENLMAIAHDSLKQYLLSSVFCKSCGPSHFADSHIDREREGIHTS